MHFITSLLLTSLFLWLAGCKQQKQPSDASSKPASITLPMEEQNVLQSLLLSYSFGGEEKLLPPVLSAHIGMGSSGPENIQNLELDYNQELDAKYIQLLINESPEWLIQPEPTIDKKRISEALNSLVETNKTSINTQNVAELHTVSARVLNQNIIDFSRDGVDSFWKTFHTKYSQNNGFSTASRVGFSRDGSIAVVYFSWTGGPTIGLGAVHVLIRENNQWQMIGIWRRLGWVS